MILRQFRKEGIDAFRQFLATCRSAPSTRLPKHMLEDSTLTEVIDPVIQVEPKRLITKGDAANLLKPTLAGLPEQNVLNNEGLWTWLTLLFFDQVCPATNGKRSVKNDYHYVFEPKNPRHYYRHLLFISWRVLQVAPKYNRLFLVSRLATLDKMTVEVMKRLYLIRIPCFFEALDRLYWDDNYGRQRPGIVGGRVKAGDLTHRLPIRMRQLEKTYDLFSLSADKLIELLGKEFERPIEMAEIG